MRNNNGEPYLRTCAITNIAWNDETKKFYEDNAPNGLIFSNLNTLFGHTIRTGEMVIANDPAHHPAGGGLPEGHPALNHYLGIPIYSGDNLVGMAGIANKKGGYTEEDVKLLKPVMSTIGGIIDSIREVADKERAQEELEQHRDTLIEMVEKKTEHLVAARNEAERANQMKSEFLSNMSHELRTPIHAIISFSRQGMERIEKWDQERQKDNLARINQSGHRLSKLLNNLLDLSKLEAGKVEYVMAKADVVSIVRAVNSEVEALALDKNIQIEFPSSAPIYVECDREKIHQVVVNLLSNAIKFTDRDKVVRITCVPENAGIKLCVIDEGVGIPDDELEAVFDKFIQSSKTKTGAGGTGLGLAICKEIIEAHQGKIWAENRTEGGSIFNFTLPTEQNTA